MDEKLLKILEDARTFYNSRRNSNQSITWADYEYFKNIMQSAGYYGYERKLLDALHM